MHKSQLLTWRFLCLYAAAVLAVVLDVAPWRSAAWFPCAVGGTAAMALVSIGRIIGKWDSERAANRRQGDWRLQIARADAAIRTSDEFSALASSLIARGIDPNQTLFLGGEFTLGGNECDYLLILPGAKWVQMRWCDARISDWTEGVENDFSDRFRAEVERYCLSRDPTMTGAYEPRHSPGI